MDGTTQEFERTRATVDGLVTSGLFPGGTVLVSRHGQTLLRYAAGFARLDPPIEATPETIWPIASISKPVAATALLQLVDRGAFGLEQRVVDLLPDFGPGKEAVLGRHLLTHSSGMVDEWPDLGDVARLGPVGALGKVPLAFEPGTAVMYCTASFEIVKALVVHYSGEAWNSYLQNHIYSPLGMRTTAFQVLPGWGDLVAWAYDMDGSTDNWANNPEDHKWEIAGRDLYSTLDDLAAFGNSFVRGARELLTPPTSEAMTRLQTGDLLDFGSGEPVTWGLGWYLSLDPRPGAFGRFMSKRAFGHGGATGTRLSIDPENGVVLVFLGNRLGMEVDESNAWQAALTDAAMQDLGLA